ncbi:MAG TPA: hypothetical protein VGU22_07215 [Methylomirabilota bacterium]|jgi:hypothetical protein|nr:hypothetical protein [Methylomirabilota bacterium]
MAMTFGIHIGHMGGPLSEMRRVWKFADEAASTGSPSPTTSRSRRRAAATSTASRGADDDPALMIPHE